MRSTSSSKDKQKTWKREQSLTKINFEACVLVKIRKSMNDRTKSLNNYLWIFLVVYQFQGFNIFKSRILSYTLEDYSNHKMLTNNSDSWCIVPISNEDIFVPQGLWYRNFFVYSIDGGEMSENVNDMNKETLLSNVESSNRYFFWELVSNIIYIRSYQSIRIVSGV